MNSDSAPQPGRIVTFYSYKGGTGRSMAVANVAWILASIGKRVLAIDWDFEAPGLHRYFHPFLRDKELTSSRGLIDFFLEFNAAARMVPDDAPMDGADAWYQSYANLLPYAYSLDWKFPLDTVTGKQGTLDFVPAGQQGPSYAVNVTSFDWRAFYEQLGGGVFIEAMKAKLRANYDYVIVDSRTGISDTAGICTVQMPDDIVLCFTLNQQSVKGAAAVADSASSQRVRANGEPSVKIWPVPTRVELNEKERLNAALDMARSVFQRHLGHLTRVERNAYWGSVQVLYQPYFAYEETLATFADRRGQTASILASMEAIASYLHRSPVTLGAMNESDRLRGLELFKLAAPKPLPAQAVIAPNRSEESVFLSYPSSERAVARVFAAAMQKQGVNVQWDGILQPGDPWRDILARELESSLIMVLIVGATIADNQLAEINFALHLDKRIAPVLLPGLGTNSLPEPLQALYATFIDDPSSVESTANSFAVQIAKLLAVPPMAPPSKPIIVDPDDPQRGQWGGQAASNGRRLSAAVTSATSDWFNIALEVSVIAGGTPLDSDVEFHLHPTFANSVARVKPNEGRAELHLSAWGAFTVGVSTDGGRTRLELDLAADPSFPAAFRAR